MSPSAVIQATLRPDGTLDLDEKPTLAPGRVQIIAQPLPELPADDPFWRGMQGIWDSQAAAGATPPDAEEIEQARRATREEWEDRLERVARASTNPFNLAMA